MKAGLCFALLCMSILLVPSFLFAQTQETVTVPKLEAGDWYWPWGTAAVLTAAVLAICFKNPKRSHEN